MSLVGPATLVKAESYNITWKFRKLLQYSMIIISLIKKSNIEFSYKSSSYSVILIIDRSRSLRRGGQDEAQED